MISDDPIASSGSRKFFCAHQRMIFLYNKIYRIPFYYFMKKSIFCLLFSVLCLLFSTWLMFRTFSFDQNTQSMEIAGKCWSDFGAHIPLIRSFSMGGNFDRIIHFKLPEYPIFPGEPIRYHFIFYMIVGLLEKAGLRIDWALNIPSIIGFSGLLILIGIISYKLFRSYAISLLSVVFFLFNGSFSFLKFFQKNPLSLHTLWDIVGNTTFPSFGPWDQGVVSAFWNLNIYTNQRHLAAGLALGLGFIALLLYLQKKSWKKQLPFLFITVPLLSFLPYFHQPMLLIIGIFMAWYFFVFSNLRILILLTGVLSVGPILSQLLSFAKDTSSFSWYPGYLIHGNLTPLSFLTYWFHNIGLHLILIPIGFFLSPQRAKKILLPMFFLFLIANCFKFSVEIAANHKFFNFFMIFGNMLSAYVIVRLWSMANKKFSLKNTTGDVYNKKYANECGEQTKFCAASLPLKDGGDGEKEIGTARQESKFSFATKAFRIFTIFIFFFLTLSGIIDFFVVYNDHTIPIVDIPRNEIPTWISENIPKDAIVLNSSYLYHPASIAGRSIFLGWPYFPWSSGYKENRMPIMKEMYENKDPNVFCPLLKKYNISYITVEEVSDNPDLPTINPSYFQTIAIPVFSSTNGTYAIYTTASLCPK